MKSLKHWVTPASVLGLWLLGSLSGYGFCNSGCSHGTAVAAAPDGEATLHCRCASVREIIRATHPLAKANQFRFSTKQQKDETDLTYYGYRYYSASVGRWLSRDPLGEELGSVNLYGFIQDDPLNFADFLGLEKCGVESFVVKWSNPLKDRKFLSKYPYALIRIDVKVKFKKGGEYDPRCCEFKQNVAHEEKSIFTHNGRESVFDITPMHDDGYSRLDDTDGNNDLSDPSFTTDDAPGLYNYEEASLSEGDVIKSYSITAEQIVYSPGKSFPADPKKKLGSCNCEKNDNVAKRGPHKASVVGTYSKKLKYTGIPATLQ